MMNSEFSVPIALLLSVTLPPPNTFISMRIARAAGLHQFVDELLHGKIAEARRSEIAGPFAGMTVRQHKVIHAADAGPAIADAGRDARAEHRHEHFVGFRSDIEFAREHFHHPTRARRIEKTARGDGVSAVDHAISADFRNAVAPLTLPSGKSCGR